MSATLHLLTIHTGCWARIVDACAHFVAALDVDVFDVEGVDVAGEVAAKLLARSVVRCGTRREGAGEQTYPRTVRRMLMSRSTPHPATRKTPMGGTVDGS